MLGVAAATAVLMTSSDAADFGERPKDVLTEEQLKRIFASADRDHDGKVTAAELLNLHSRARSIFAKKDIPVAMRSMDLDKDGQLSLAELTKTRTEPDRATASEQELKDFEGVQEMEKAAFAEADVDKSGFLSKHEADAFFFPETNDKVLAVITAAMIKRADLDKSGKVSLNEYAPFDTGRHGMDTADYFKLIDANQDGELDLEELMRSESGHRHVELAVAELWKMADADGDEMATLEELLAVREKMHGSDAHYHFMEWSRHGPGGEL